MTTTPHPAGADTDALLAAVTRDPTRSDLAAALALRAMEGRREEDVLPAVAAAARRSPRDVPLLHCLGLLHRAVGDLAPAIAAFDAAIAIAPPGARLAHARARAALDAGVDSLGWFARARALAPSDGDVILGEAAALLAARRAGEADALLAGMLRVHPGWLPGHDALIRLRHAHGAADTAGASLDAAIAEAPGDARLHALAIAVAQRAPDAAAAALARAAAALGETPLVRDGRAILATERGDLDAADRAFSVIDPTGSAELAIHWMRHLLRRNAPERVTAFADRLAPAIRDVAWPYRSLAWRLLGDDRAAWLDDPALIRVFDLGLPPAELDRLAASLRDLHVGEAQPLDQSVRGGTQTDGPLFSRVAPEIVSLKARVRAAVATYLAELPRPDPAHPLLGRVPRHPRFVGSWSVRLAGGGHHDPHVHDHGLVSSAFYVSLPDDPGDLTLGEAQASLGVALPPTRIVTPRRGTLVLFPSTAWHATRPFARGERLTVAFDVA